LNVPYEGGKILHDLVAKGRFCFTAHNAPWRSDAGIQSFLEYVRRNPKFRTIIEIGSGEGDLCELQNLRIMK
jgi:hypothetical protein